jgi:hypothetical protein
VLTITAQQPLVVNTNHFVVYDADGENSVTAPRTARFDPGVHELTLNFSTRQRPLAIGWVPQDGQGGAAVWERP